MNALKSLTVAALVLGLSFAALAVDPQAQPHGRQDRRARHRAARRARDRQLRLQGSAAQKPGQRCQRHSGRAQGPGLRGNAQNQRQSEANETGAARIRPGVEKRRGRAVLLRRPRHPVPGPELPHPGRRQRRIRGRTGGRVRGRQPGALLHGGRAEPGEHRGDGRLPQQSVYAQLPLRVPRPGADGGGPGQLHRLRHRPRLGRGRRRRPQRRVYQAPARQS